MTPRSIPRAVCCALLWLSVALVPARAHAAATVELRYTRAQIFSGALRYLRIDLGYEITEKDDTAAYLLFRYVPQGMNEPTFGAIEIVQVSDGVKLSVKLPKLPSYHEAMIRDGLLLKLKTDYGGEPDPKRPSKDEGKPKNPPPDDSSNQGKSKEEKPKNDDDE
jgi:hypothetical protein